MTTLLIDADGVAYQAAAAVERGIRWDDDVYTLHADLGEAKASFAATIEGYLDQVDASADIILCFSCPSRRYFRHGLLPSYKANRKGNPPLVLRDLKEWASEKYETKTKPHLEADDVLGILATHPKLIRGQRIVVSADKDLQQIAGLHLNARAPSEDVFRVDEDAALRFLWLQVLTGDSTDNYTGLPGVGPVKAGRILDTPGLDYEDTVMAAYDKAGVSPEDMAVQVNVARLLQSHTYDFNKKEPILWQRQT